MTSRKSMLRRDLLRRLLWAFRLGLIAVGIMAIFWGYRTYEAVSARDLRLSSFLPHGRREAPRARVGLVAGHWQSDSGAVCPDGLREVEINLNVAYRTANVLHGMGYEVDVWPEFGQGLNNYQAAALVSIHADSCLDRSGFKVAHAAQSAIPAVEGELVRYLTQAYAAHTSLEEDPRTITVDMTSYHAFYKIAAQTPAAIIELGYMGGDRRLLLNDPGRAARGVAAGIAAFLESTTLEY